VVTEDRGELASPASVQGAWTVVAAPGEVDPSTAPALQAAIDELRENGISRLAVDWSGVTFFDSSAIGVLIVAHFAVTEAGGQFAVIVSTRHRARRLFDLMGLDQVLTFVDSVDDLDWVRVGPAAADGPGRSGTGGRPEAEIGGG
jgi:anti-anti-sigma factor